MLGLILCCHPPKILNNFYLFLIFIYLFIYLFLALQGLCCCVWAFSSCGQRGLLFVAACELLTAVASLVAQHGSQAQAQQLQHVGSVVVAHGLQSTGSVVVAHGLSCSAAWGIFPDQGSNPCPPALAGGFLTTVPPEKSPRIIFKQEAPHFHFAPRAAIYIVSPKGIEE